jgi:hypothetical protein
VNVWNKINKTNNGHIQLHIKYKIKCCSGVDMYQKKYKYGISSPDHPLECMNTDCKHGYEDVISDVLMTWNIRLSSGMECYIT